MPLPCPSMSRPRKFTTSVVAASMMMAMRPFGARMPAVPASQEMVIALVMVTVSKLPGSRQLISPPGVVFAMAAAKVLHGAVRLQGLASLPTPETHVRDSWACVGEAARNGNASLMTESESATLRMMDLPCVDRLARRCWIEPHPNPQPFETRDKPTYGGLRSGPRRRKLARCVS